MGFVQKSGHMGGGEGGLVVRNLFFHFYFPYYFFDAYSNGSYEGFLFCFSKNGVFNLGVCFFFLDLEKSHFQI